MTRQWTRVVLKGRAQVIPAVCPNCLQAADQKYRYGYKGLQGWLTRTTYYQTFTYCPACHPQAVSHLGLRRWGVFAGVMALLFSIPLLVGIVDFLKPRLTGWSTDFQMFVTFVLAALGGLCIWALIYFTARRIKQGRRPLRPEQAVWGLAAFYTGGTHLGFSSSTSVYKAARPEWIAALVKANPDQVDDATYQCMVGDARPGTTGNERPFGPA
jgi:hypothetical protein